MISIPHMIIGIIIFLVAALYIMSANEYAITDTFTAVFIPLTEEEKHVAEMDKYSTNVKKAIRNIKQNLKFRPPLAVLPFVRMLGHNVAAPNYGLGNCVVEKSMCTQMNAIICYLLDSEAFLANNRSIVTENWLNTFCYGKNDYETWEQLQQVVPGKLETSFIVRDPVNRFISAYIDKCVHEKVECYGCYTNFTCVVEKVFESNVQMSRNHSRIEERNDLVKEMSYEGRHFAPLTWYCDLWDRFEDFHFFKYGEDNESFNRTRLAVIDFFRSQEVETHKMEYIVDSLNTRSSHATKTSYSELRTEIQHTLYNSTRLLEIMTDMYYYDYIVFGFKPPIEIYLPNI